MKRSLRPFHFTFLISKSIIFMGEYYVNTQD